MIGTAVRQYKVESKIGSGGMGVVYKAWDQKLNRHAALKLLPPTALESEERRRRFAHEAKVSSGLNHPNIVSIYEVGSEDISGQLSDFIAMELVEGLTLDQVINKQGLTVEKAVSFAIQIASALTAAHSAGIVHRDLKPSNIMIRNDGTVKILDFGLAKVSAPLEPDPFGDTQSVHMSMTSTGTIVGSVAYMSPEQAEGKTVDPRSDIFSLGSVLYEMLCGRAAFQGDTRISKISAVILKDPDPLPDTVPVELRQIIGRCHQKNPDLRYPSMAHLRAALEKVRTKPSLIQSRRAWIAAASAFAAGVAPTAYFAFRSQKRQPQYQRLTFRRGDVTGAKFAPGGSVYFSAQWEGEMQSIYECQPGNRESRPIAVPGGRLLSVSSKSELAILTGDGLFGTLIRVQPGGGAPRPVLDNVHDAVWGLDGDSFAVVRRDGSRFRVESPIGKVIATSEAKAQERIALSGKGVTFFQFDPTTGDYDLQATVDGGAPKTLSRGWRAVGGLTWSPNGSEIWFAGTRTGGDPALYAVSTSGKERLLLQTPGWLSPLDVNRAGALLCSNTSSRLGIRVSVHGKDRDFSWLESSSAREFSADGSALLFVELAYGEGRNAAIFLRKLDGSPAVRLGHGNRPSLSQDGKFVACIRRDEKMTTIQIIPTGAGEQRSISHPGMDYESLEWFPDSDRLLVLARRAAEASRAWIQPLGREPIPVTPAGVRAVRLSPDGRLVAGIQDGKVLTFPVDQSQPRVVAPALPGEAIVRWSPDGDVLVLKHSRDNSTSVFLDRLDVRTGRRTLWQEIPLPEGATQFLEPFVVSPRMTEYAYSYQHDTATLYTINGLS